MTVTACTLAALLSFEAASAVKDPCELTDDRCKAALYERRSVTAATADHRARYAALGVRGPANQTARACQTAGSPLREQTPRAAGRRTPGGPRTCPKARGEPIPSDIGAGPVKFCSSHRADHDTGRLGADHLGACSNAEADPARGRGRRHLGATSRRRADARRVGPGASRLFTRAGARLDDRWRGHAWRRRGTHRGRRCHGAPRDRNPPRGRRAPRDVRCLRAARRGDPRRRACTRLQRREVADRRACVGWWHDDRHRRGPGDGRRAKDVSQRQAHGACARPRGPCVSRTFLTD